MANQRTFKDAEAAALAACYHLLFRKAAERRARLAGAEETAVLQTDQTIEIPKEDSNEEGK